MRHHESRWAHALVLTDPSLLGEDTRGGQREDLNKVLPNLVAPYSLWGLQKPFMPRCTPLETQV